MLLENNTYKVIELIYQFDNLSNIDKVRLTIYLLENKYFNVDFNIEDMINTLKSILGKLDSNYTKVITNFSKYKHLLFFSAKYLELTEKEKKHFSVEMIFNIYETDFNNNVINKEINNNLLVYHYYYSLFVKVNIKMHKNLKIKMYKIFNQFCIGSETSESIFNLSFNR